MTEEQDDVPGMWRAKKDASKIKRAENMCRSTGRLREFGIAFEERADGNHLIVRHAGEVVDFWPTTGLYIPRSTGKRGRGVFHLIRWLQRQAKLQPIAQEAGDGEAHA